MAKKSWNQLIRPHLIKYKSKTNRIFNAHKAEVQRKKITSLTEINSLWNRKYKPMLNKVEKEMDREYKKIWTTYHKNNSK